MRPILRYYGAKWRIADWIISHMPPHRIYLEPFSGSCAVLLNKAPAEIETINDIDGEVVNFFKMLRDWPSAVVAGISLTPWARDEFVESREFEGNSIERARRFAVACWMSMGSRITGRPTQRSNTCARLCALIAIDKNKRKRPAPSLPARSAPVGEKFFYASTLYQKI